MPGTNGSWPLGCKLRSPWRCDHEEAVFNTALPVVGYARHSWLVRTVPPASSQHGAILRLVYALVRAWCAATCTEDVPYPDVAALSGLPGARRAAHHANVAVGYTAAVEASLGGQPLQRIKRRTAYDGQGFAS